MWTISHTSYWRVTCSCEGAFPIVLEKKLFRKVSFFPWSLSPLKVRTLGGCIWVEFKRNSWLFSLSKNTQLVVLLLTSWTKKNSPIFQIFPTHVSDRLGLRQLGSYFTLNVNELSHPNWRREDGPLHSSWSAYIDSKKQGRLILVGFFMAIFSIFRPQIG